MMTDMQEVYHNIITQFVPLLEPDERDCIFQQDGATTHTARLTTEFLREFFGEWLLNAPFWSPSSADLSVADYFLWGYLKNEVYKTSPATINELKQKVTDTIARITQF